MGEIFGRYELLRRIGVGGMAEVFIAKTFGAEGFVKNIVIKRILPAFGEDPEFVRMFINEARLAAKLQHANIVQIYDFNQVDGVYYIAMEWVDGLDLRRIYQTAKRRSLPMPIRSAVHVGVETLKGLHFAHLKAEGGRPLQIVHRDISPHNLLISFAGEVKLTDFGIAKAAVFASATRSGVVKGKLAYMSPEQVNNQPLDNRSDLFSLGIVLWELLAGRRLYQADNELALISMIRQAEIPSLREIQPDIPPDLENAIQRLLRSRPEGRFPTAAEALNELSRFAEVDDSLAVAEYLRRLLPAEVDRDRKGETQVMVFKQEDAEVEAGALSDALTRTSAQQSSMEAGSPSSAGPRAVLDQSVASSLPVAGSDTSQEAKAIHHRTTVTRRISFVFVLTMLFFGGVGWWIFSKHVTEKEMEGMGLLRVETSPPATKIWVNGVVMGMAPLLLRGKKGTEFLIEARAGDVASRQYKRVSLDQERVLLRLPTLGSQAKKATDITISSVNDSTLNRSPAEPFKSKSLPKHAEAPISLKRATTPHENKRRQGAAKVERFGMLDVVVFPWAKVIIDGREIGQTPFRKYRLEEGKHSVELINSELNKKEKMLIRIIPGQQIVLRRTWGE